MAARRLNHLRRTIMDHTATAAAAGCVVLVLLPLFAIFGYLVFKGIGSVNLAFFTNIPKPVGELGGGMANAIAGSAIILAIASLLGVPVGIGAGVFLAEVKSSRLTTAVRFTADVLNGVPSIVVGIAAYGLIVIRQHHFSALAGGIALAFMMVPTITRTTEEMLLLVPHSVREAAFGLGIPTWRTTLSVILPAAKSGIITGVMLAFARAAGETAPLLFTTLGNSFWNLRLDQPMAALPLQIYVYAISPYDDWHRQAFAGALILILLIVMTTTALRLAARHTVNRGAL